MGYLRPFLFQCFLFKLPAYDMTQLISILLQIIWPPDVPFLLERHLCVLLKRGITTLPFQQNVLFSNLGARTAARALQIYDLLKRKSFFELCMKRTFYLKQILLKQK